MPYGEQVLEELASVAQNIADQSPKTVDHCVALAIISL